jgi:replication factor A2
MYVRVVGHLRSFSNKRSLTAFSIKRVKDFNEVTCHMLEVIKTHLENTKGAPGMAGVQQQAPGMALAPTAMGGGGMTGGMPQQQQQQQQMQQQQQQQQQQGAGMPQQQQQQPAAGGLALLQQQAQAKPTQAPNNDIELVFCAFQQGTGEQGMDTADVKNQLATVMTGNTVDEAVSYLTDEGHLYSTTDESHYKTTF